MNPEPKIPRSSGHEITPWRARPFVIGLMGFLIFMGLVYFIVGGLTASWAHHVWPQRHPESGPQTTPGWNDSVPQLQVHASQDLRRVRADEDQHLHSPRWMDETHAFAAIPIERAMALLVQADAHHQLNQVLPAPQPATPEQLQDQKSSAAAPASSP